MIITTIDSTKTISLHHIVGGDLIISQSNVVFFSFDYVGPILYLMFVICNLCCEWPTLDKV